MYSHHVVVVVVVNLVFIIYNPGVLLLQMSDHGEVS